MARKEKYQDGYYEFEDVSSYSSNSAYRRSNRVKKKKHTGLKVFISFLCVLLIVVGGGILFLSQYLLGGLSTNRITRDKDELGIVSGVTSDARIVNIALFGVDSREDDFSGRSDAIMILSIDQIHNKIKMTSLLRDIRVYMSEDYNFTGSGYDKLNHAYAFGGPEYALKVINQTYKLDVQDYVTVNFNKLAQIVDAVGGIDIEISQGELDLLNEYLLSLDPNQEPLTQYGAVHVNGAQAVAYSRNRYIGGDNQRAERQQTVLTAIMKQIKTMSKLEYPSLINQMADLCETSMDVGKIMSFVPFALGDFSIDHLVIPSDVEGYSSDYMENGGWMWLYDTDVAADHLERFIYDDETE